MICASLETSNLLSYNFFSTGQVKYRLWLWHMMAFEKAIWSSRKAFEYKWNTTCNVNGGAERNIPDDNLVELHVKMLKEQLACQGSRVSFESA